jgi:serine/threonine protein kinase
MALGPGTILKGKYRVVDRLGSGGMGMVWQGRDLDLNRDVAIKVMLNADDDLESFKRFQREAQVAARLQHPGITVVHDFGRDHDQFFIVMELLKGVDLKGLLREHPAGLPAERVTKLALLAAEALSAAHENGVVHRDIKPANLFVLPDDRIKICDFGIAKLADATSALTGSGMLVGTLAYMSPEQWKNESASARSDLYSLGCVLYAMVSGHPPFAEDQGLPALMYQHVSVVPEPPRGTHAVPGALSDLVMRLLAKDPSARPATAAELAADLRDISLSPRDWQQQSEPVYRAGRLGRPSSTAWSPRDARQDTATASVGEIGPAPGSTRDQAEEMWPALFSGLDQLSELDQPDQRSRHRAVSRPRPPFTRVAQTMALVVFLTTAVICCGPLLGLEPSGWLFLEIPGAFFALVLGGVGIGVMPDTLPHPGSRRFAVSLTMGAAEAGLMLFITGTLPALTCVAIGVIPFMTGMGIVLDSAPGSPWS